MKRFPGVIKFTPETGVATGVGVNALRRQYRHV
jgi:hypothetical protein